MNKAKLNKILWLALVLALMPTLAFAATGTTNTAPTTIGVPQGFGGIFSCNQNGSYAMSVGALGATGGVFVPVADASVELNTGTLVYKECVLREVVDAQRMAATAGFTQQGTSQILTGNNGAAQFLQYQTQAFNQAGTNGVVAFLKNNPNIPAQVKQAIAQGYATAIYNAPSTLTCPYPGSTSDFTSANSQGNIWSDMLAVASPCNPLFQYIGANDLATGYAAQEQNCLQNQLQWGGGFYAITTGSGGPCEQQIVTPSSNVNSLYTQILQSPYNQLQNANDIGQMVGALFAGIGTQVLSGTGGGITGLTQPIGNQPSYLQQAVSQETQNLQSTVANAALVNLDAAFTVESQYNTIMGTIAGNLEGTISTLRNAENVCWNDVIQAACSASSTPSTTNGVSTCTGTNGQQLKISTSTEFSQPVINLKIAALASTTAQNLQISQQALNLINQLIVNVSGSSADSQAVAIEQLNTLIANNELHTSADLTTAQAQASAVQTAMSSIAQNTPVLWAGSDPNNPSNPSVAWNNSVGATINAGDPGEGWCNFQNQTTIQDWQNIWKT